MKEKDKGEKKEFKYIHEIIGDSKRKGMRWLLKIIMITMIGGAIIGMVVSVCISDYVPGLLSYAETKEQYKNILENTTTTAYKETSDDGKSEDESGVRKEETSDASDNKSQEEITTEENVNAATDGIDIAKSSVVKVTAIATNGRWTNIRKKYESAVCVFASYKVLIFIADGNNIKDDDKITITLSDDKEYDATIRKKDDITGIVALTVDGSNIPEEVQNSITIPVVDSRNKLEKHDMAYIIGTPYGDKRIVLNGEIKSIAQPVSRTDGMYYNYLTDIKYNDTVNGFMFNDKGNLEAVILQNMQDEKTSGIITAMPICEIKTRVQNICNGMDAMYVGINGADITDDVKSQADRNMPYGVYVKSCEIDSPAYRAGILSGDIIVSVNDESIKNLRDLKNAFDKYYTDEYINMVIMRSGKNEYKEIKYRIKMKNS